MNNRWPLLLIGACIGVFMILVLVLEDKWNEQTEKLAEQHVAVVAKSLWDYYPEGVEAYINLAVNLGDYEYIKVIDKTGNSFISADGSAEMAGSLLVQLGLIRRSISEREIVYEGHVIGALTASRWNTCIYQHVNVFALLLLVLFGLWLLGKLMEAKKNLEKNVKERTQELLGTVAQLTQEIAERQRAERELDVEKEKWSEHIENAPIAILITDKNNVVEEANPAACALIGRSASDLIGSTLDELGEEQSGVPGEHPVADDTSFQRLNLVLQAQNEAEITASVTRVELANDQFLVSIIDDTERLKLEEQLRHSEKMSAMGQIASGVAHDFNNQLQAILSCSELLMRRIQAGQNEKVGTYLAQIQNACQRSTDLVHGLLAFGRRTAAGTKEFNCHDTIKDVQSILRHSIDKRIKVEVDIQAEQTHVCGDPSQFENALLNLCLNARDAMSGVGTLSIRTENVGIDEVRRLSGQELVPGEYLVLNVSDTGAGISADNLDRIFEPFFTTKEVGKGTGLGLAAVYGTIGSFNGAIQVQSQLGVGTTFRVYLPIIQRQEVARSEPPVSDGFVSTGLGLCLFIAEDEEPVREMLCDLFVDEQCDVSAHKDGVDLLEALRATDKRVDGVIVDMNMPRMGGEEVVQILTQEFAHLPIIMLTGHGIVSDLDPALRERVTMLRKPISVNELVEKVGTLFR